MPRTALFTGRFQPPTRAHAHTVDRILLQWSTLLIGVSDSTIPGTYEPQWEEFVRSSASRQTSAKRIFSASEITDLWVAHIREAGLSDRVTCMPIQRPHLRGFNDAYPPQQFDMVSLEPHEDDSESDRVRHRLFSPLLGRPIFHVTPDFVMHNSEIRDRISAGASWNEFLTPGTYDVFLSMNGPERMRAAR